jgi:hypothetical protein
MSAAVAVASRALHLNSLAMVVAEDEPDTEA